MVSFATCSKHALLGQISQFLRPNAQPWYAFVLLGENGTVNAHVDSSQFISRCSLDGGLASRVLCKSSGIMTCLSRSDTERNEQQNGHRRTHLTGHRSSFSSALRQEPHLQSNGTEACTEVMLQSRQETPKTITGALTRVCGRARCRRIGA